MKTKKLLTMCLLAFLGNMAVHAYDIVQNGIYLNITGDNTAEVTYVVDGEDNAVFYSGDVSIPRLATKDNVIYTVTAIGDKAFNNCSDVTSVTIPNTVTSIGNDAFSGCSSLATITIPGNVTTIGSRAFESCSGLTTVIVKTITPLPITSDVFSSSYNATLIVPFACKPAYEAADYWTKFQVIVEAEPLQMLTRSLEVLANDNYTAFPVEALDMTAICELLGTESPVVYCIGRDDEKTNEYNLTPHPGFWCDAEGKVISHDDDNCRIGYAFVTDHLEVYQKPGWVQDLGGDYMLYMYLVNEENGNYVTVETSVHVNPVSIANPNVVLTSADSANVPLEFAEETGDYPAQQLATLDMTAIKEAVGTEEPVIYAMDGSGNITKRYTLTPKPGFWFNSECKVCGFGSDDVIGYSFVGDHLEIYQHPGRTNEGDTYTLNIYFVNEATLACAEHSTTITIVPKEADIANNTILPWGAQQAWEMKYMYYDEMGNEPNADAAGHAWTDTDYDDSGWSVLTGPIARNSDTFSTVNTLWEQERSCYYMRRTFNLDQIAPQGYSLFSRNDDNLKVWINGNQVIDAPYNSAMQFHHIPASAFKEGTNTIAIYLDDNGGGDAYLDYSLGSLFYLKNVETGKYLSNGNTFNTHAVLADEPLPVSINKQDDGNYTIFFPVGSNSRQLLYRANEMDVFVDYNEEFENACPYWTITEAGSGNYHFQTLTTHETYGQDAMPGTYLGNNPNKADYSNDVDGNVLNAEGMNITWTLEPEGLHTTTQSDRLRELINQANALHIDTDLAQAILANENATYTEMLAQILQLNGWINEGIWFEDEKVRELCVANWDTNKDGALSKAEAGAVTDLGEVFKGNTEITQFNELRFFTALRTIGDEAFEGCCSLESVELPEGITEIKNNAFRGSGLESIKFPSTLTSVGESAFSYSNLSNIDFNGCSATFDYGAFSNCNSLEQVYIPNTVSINGIQVFNWCESLKKVEFQEGYDCSAHTTFWHCTNLEEVILPTTKVFGWVGWFLECPNIKTVTFLDVCEEEGIWQVWHYNQQFDLADPTSCRFIIPEGKAELFLRKGYMNLSDLSGLPFVRREFEAEAERIATMAEALSDGDKTTLNDAINAARTTVNAAEDYLTVFAQIDAIKTAAKSYLTTATLPEEFDVTAAAITNPDIENYAIGWKLSMSMMNVGYKEDSYSNGDIRIDNFVEVWGDDGSVVQTIPKLPAGIYRLEADIIAANQDDASVEVTGVSLFAGNQSTPVATENEKPQHFSVKFENSRTMDVTIGINSSNTNANWVAADNFRLYYEGPVAAAPSGTELVSSEDATYYIYNVDTGMYLNGGNGWGTQAVLAETGLPVRMTQDDEGYWQIYFREGSRYQQLLFRSTDRSAFFIDYQGSGEACWNITSQDEGTYIIQNKYDADETNGLFFGNDPSLADHDYQQNITLDTHVDIIPTTTNIHWQFIAKADYDLSIAKRYLLATIFRMEQSDVNNEDLLNSAQAVYDNEASTLEEVIAATTLLNSQMGMPQQDQPVDMTALIVNPRFENNTPDGWTGAKLYDSGFAQNTQHQTHEFFQTSFNMFQTITGVPNGRYMLKWKGFHRPGNWEQVCTDYLAGIDNASAVVYANDVEKTMKHIYTGASDTRLDESDKQYNNTYTPYFPVGARAYFDAGFYADQLEVEVTDNVLTIGVKNTQPMSGGHWVIFSDFELYIMENEEQLYHKLTADNVKCVPGCLTTFNVNLLNRDDVTAFQFDVELPEGVSIYEENGQKEAELTTRGNGHMFQCIKTDENTYQFSALSLASKSFKKNEGPIVRMTLTTDGSKELGDYPIKVKNTELSKPNGMMVLPFDFTSTLTIKAADPGDVNGDGKITVTDAVYVFKYVNGETPEHFQKRAADVNNSNSITINDAVQIVNMILGNGQKMSSRAAKKLLKQLAREY